MIFDTKRFTELIASKYETQKEYANQSDLAENEIAQYKLGNRQPTTKKLLQIANDFHVDVRDLIIATPIDLYAYREYEVLNELLEEIVAEEDPERLDMLLSKYQVIAKSHEGLYGKRDLVWDRKSSDEDNDDEESEWEL